MASHGIEISLELRVAVATCRLLYCESFDVIERRTGVNKRSAFVLMLRAINRAGNEDFHDILVCLKSLDRPEGPARIEDQSDLSKTVR